MAVKIQQVQVALQSDVANAVYDITIPDFGFPKAVIVMSTNKTDNGISEGLSRFSFGAYDGTSQYAMAYTSSDGATSSAARMLTADRVISWTTADATEFIGFAAIGFINNGITIQQRSGTSSLSRLATFIFIGGDGLLNKKVTTAQLTGLTSAINVGFEPSLVFASCPGTFGGALPTSSASVVNSLGVALNDGNDTNKGAVYYERNSVTTSQVSLIRAASYSIGKILSSGLQFTARIENYTATGFSVVATESGGSATDNWVAFLSLEFAPDVNLALIDTAVGGATYSETVGFQPDFGLIATQDSTPIPDVTQSNTASIYAVSYASFTDTSVNSYGSSQAGASAIDPNCHADDNLLAVWPSGAVKKQSSSYSINSTGWEFINAVDGGGLVNGFALAIGNAGAAGAKEMYIKDGGVFVKGVPHVLASGVWQPADAYVLVSGVWKPVYEQ